ncbi:conserved Plasmodium protein, unknown function [Plasmodium gallinaceum]|uniref:Uncharacterized protein n=1 Tax=Plasmodium gallinaceum TaxID=5849 RepID=A0A1J1GR07_PLAGA|nr:conserved Plasmodium protein, unknown function [Plasmodium gallinaceum]CRG94700.1 conserved Plasmodium protein, unknown function [Plasmodium gallinaceum]
MSTGWNFNFNQKKYTEKKRKKKLKYIKLFNKRSIKNFKKKNELLVRKRLNCGPAGRNALIKWIEYNYKLKNDEENRYPAVNACKVWQQTQSFQDIVLSGLVDFLKFLNVPKHITYKNVFDNYLSPKFINKINSITISQKCLIKLAKKMILMFQVREIQPLFSVLLEKIDIIPLDILNILVEKTPAAKYFYEITSVKVKRKIWTLCPHKFFEEVEHIIEEIILRMKIKNSYDIICNLINKIIELIGEDKEKKFLYNLCVHIIRLKSLETILNAKENVSNVSYVNKKCNKEYKNDSGYNISAIKITENNTVSKITELNENNEENKCNEIDINNKIYKKIRKNLNPNSYSLPNDFEDKLKKLHICFDKIMNKKENLQNKDTDYNDKFQPYYISLNEYNHNNTSFQFLKKRKQKKKKYPIYNMKKDETKITADEKNSGNIFRNINNNHYEEKSNFKRSLIMNKEKIKTKKMKINLNSSNEKDTIENVSVNPDKQINDVNDKILYEKINSNDNNKSNNNNKDNNKITENIEVNKKINAEKNKYKINKEEHLQNKTLLPFDNMFYSNLRLMLCLQYKEKYNINDEEMLSIDKHFYIIEFINHIIKDGILSFGDEIKVQEIINKTQKYFKIKNIDDLYEYSLLFNNILLKFSIIEGICFYFYNNNFNILTLKNNIKFWISLFYFGIYNNFFSLIKYAVDKIEYDEKKKKSIKPDKKKEEFCFEGELKLKENMKKKKKSFNKHIMETKDKNGYKEKNKNLNICKVYENEDDGGKIKNNDKENENIDEEDKNRYDNEDDNNVEDSDDDENSNCDIKDNEVHNKKSENENFIDSKKKEYINENKSKDYNKINEYECNIHEGKEHLICKNKEEYIEKEFKTCNKEKENKLINYKSYFLNNTNKNISLEKKKKKNIEPNLKVKTSYLKDLKKIKGENFQDIPMKGEVKSNNLKLFFNIWKESYLKIPLMNILNYIITPNNIENNFFSFFNFFDEDNIEKLKKTKEKNSILLLSALLNIPQLDYIEIKNFFSIIDEFFFLEKKNFTLIKSNNPINSDSIHQNISGKKIIVDNKINLKNESFKNSNKFDSINVEVGNVTNNNNFNMNKNIIGEINNYLSKNNENIDFDKKRKLNDYNETNRNFDSDIDAFKEKNIFHEIGRKLINYINYMNNAISDNKFLVNNNICSIYIYLKDINAKYTDDVNIPLKYKFNNTEKDEIKNKTYSMNFFCDISNELLEKLNYKGKIKKYFPYILKICFIFLNFFKKKKLISIYKKYLYLYGYLYHMVLNRIFYISTVKSIPVLQNIILKELHFYFEDFKNMKEKNLWKFFLYAHTLIDINHIKSNSLNKLFHNNAIDYFIKLFYYLSFYNPTFSIIFLKLIETSLFFKHIENKRTEILQNLWIGTHEGSLFYFFKNKKYSVEYKIWIDSYNKFFEK